MRVLIGQPIHDEGISQLQKDIKDSKGTNIVLYPEGYLANENALQSACNTAKEDNVMIITSYRNCGNSIPISYFIDSNGESLYISKSDTRTRIVNMDTNKVEVL